MGLCGSLSPRYTIGDIVLYQDCVYESKEPTPLAQSCDRQLTTLLHQKLKERVPLVNSLTSDRLVYSASEKRRLGQIYNTEVVDMEGFAALEVLTQAGVAVAMVRVISDDSHHNIPNLTSAISPNGSLQPLSLAIGMLRQPIAATRLIRGALHGLQVLQKVTTVLFAE
jgi:nucleoside phosphorylase